MFGLEPEAPEIDAPKILDGIQKEVYTVLKPYGFRKHGRTLHRFVSGDLSQVVNFQLGQAYLGHSHLLFVNIGIRVPESFLRSFQPEETPKKYYHEYECNLRSRLGSVEGREESVYDLRHPTDAITADILRQLTEVVLPVFEELCSREAILEKRRSYPQFDLMNNHLILLEEAMIYGRREELKLAEQCFRQHFRSAVEAKKPHKGHIRYLRELAEKLGIALNKPMKP